jgi:hypothetical protein
MVSHGKSLARTLCPPISRNPFYRDGAARLNQEARSRYGKPFAELSDADADTILALLREAWTCQGPSDPFVLGGAALEV